MKIHKDIVDSNNAIKTTAKIGQAIHKTYDPIKETVEEANKLINKTLTKCDSKLRPDALDFANKIIYELKPYNANSLKRAVKQVNKYIEALGEGFTVVIDMYLR